MKIHCVESRLTALETALAARVEVENDPYANATREKLFEFAGRIVAYEAEHPGTCEPELLELCKTTAANAA